MIIWINRDLTTLLLRMNRSLAA